MPAFTEALRQNEQAIKTLRFSFYRHYDLLFIHAGNWHG